MSNKFCQIGSMSLACNHSTFIFLLPKMTWYFLFFTFFHPVFLGILTKPRENVRISRLADAKETEIDSVLKKNVNLFVSCWRNQNLVALILKIPKLPFANLKWMKAPVMIPSKGGITITKEALAFLLFTEVVPEIGTYSFYLRYIWSKLVLKWTCNSWIYNQIHQFRQDKIEKL